MVRVLKHEGSGTLNIKVLTSVAMLQSGASLSAPELPKAYIRRSQGGER